MLDKKSLILKNIEHNVRFSVVDFDFLLECQGVNLRNLAELPGAK